jgi:hypothetical protein
MRIPEKGIGTGNVLGEKAWFVASTIRPMNTANVLIFSRLQDERLRDAPHAHQTVMIENARHRP